MSSQSSGSGRRRVNTRQYSAEDEALNLISDEAEARLAAKRAARAEARDIRLKELEKQQKESEGKQDRVSELSNENAAAKVRQQLSGSRSGSRRGSTESNDSDTKDADFKGELRELEMKYKAAMMTSAQLDNEKQSLVYQVELLKDQLEEQDEEHTELLREYKEKCRQYDFQKRDLKSMEHDLNILKQQLEIKDKLIEESGFVILSNDRGEPALQKSSQNNSSNGPAGTLLVSTEIRDILRKADGATLGTTAVAEFNTNKSGVSSKAVTQARCLVADGSVADEVDSSAVEKVLLSEVCSGDNISEKHASDVVLHESSEIRYDESMSCEHELSKVEHLEEGNKKAASGETESSFIPGEADAEYPTQRKESSGLSAAGSYPIIPVSESDKDSVDNENDEFFDAISTPSPSSHTTKFDVQEISSHKVLTDGSEGTSVDPEIRSEENITRMKPVHVDSERRSLIVENVTETESSTDIVDKNENDSNKGNHSKTEGSTDILDKNERINIQNVTVTESSLDVIDQNEKCANEDDVEEIASQDTENKDHADILNTSTSEHIEVEALFSIESPVGEPPLETKVTKENIVEDNDLDTEVNSCDQNSENLHTCSKGLIQDDAETAQHDEVKETEQIADTTQSDVCEVQDSSVSINSEVSHASCTTDLLDEDTPVKQDNEGIVEVTEDTELVKISKDGVNIESENVEKTEGVECRESKVENQEEVPENDKDISNNMQQAVKGEESDDEKDGGSPIKDTSKIIVRTPSRVGSEASDGAALDDYDLDDIDDILNTDVPLSANTFEPSTTPGTHVEETVTETTESIDQEDRNSVKSIGDKDVEKKEETKDNVNKKSKDKSKTSKKDDKEKRKSSYKEGKDKTEKIKSKDKESKDKADKSKSSKKEDSHEKKSEKRKQSKKEASQDSKTGATGGEESKHILDESQTSLEPDDLEQALEKQMQESEGGKSHKKSSKKLSIFKKVFK